MKRFLPHLTVQEQPRISDAEKRVLEVRYVTVSDSFAQVHNNVCNTAPQTLQEMMQEDAAERARARAGTLAMPVEAQAPPVQSPVETAPLQPVGALDSAAIRNLVDAHSVPTTQMQLDQINNHEAPNRG